jgi:CBS domain-containing protein
MATLIEHLTYDRPELVTISPNATLQEAVGLMIEHDFSQLPVIEDGKPYGNPASFVTSTSIARALRYFGTPLKDLRVRDAAVPARTVSVDEDLFSKMDDLLDAYAVLVLNPDGTIAGIVTNYDTTHYFRRRAEDMLLVEDIETTLKDHVRVAFGGDENDPEGPIQTAINALSSFVDDIQDDCRKSFRRFCAAKSIQIVDADILEVVDKPFSGTKRDRKFDDLTLNEYIQLARKEAAWKLLGPQFGISDKAFLEMLGGVNKTRNKLMHFRPDITPVERDNLRFCAQWFKNYPPITAEEESGVVEEQLRIGVPPAGQQGPSTEGDGEGIEEGTPDVGDHDSIDIEPVESKYAPLASFLSRQPKGQERITLTFDQIETIISNQLPAAAREHRSWWANDSTTHVQSGQWLKVNWRVVSINMTREKVVFARARDRERAYIDFFSAVQNRLREHAAFPLRPANPTGASWLTLVNFPERKTWLTLSFALRQRLRLEFYIDTGDKEENYRIFDAFLRQRAHIESAMGQTLEWERLEKKRASRIALYTEGSITDEPEKLEALVEWSVENALRFFNTISGLLNEITVVPSLTDN